MFGVELFSMKSYNEPYARHPPFYEIFLGNILFYGKLNAVWVKKCIFAAK